MQNQDPASGHYPQTPSERDPAADLAMVRGVLEGVESACVQLDQCLQCIPRILAGQNARLGHPLRRDELDDVAQNVALLALKKLSTYAGLSPLAGWIYRLCHFELRNATRKQQRHRRRHHALSPEHEPVDPASLEELKKMSERERLYRAIERVGGVEAQIIGLKHFQRLKFKEIAPQLKMPLNTAKTAYYRGLRKLEQILRAEKERDE